MSIQTDSIILVPELARVKQKNGFDATEESTTSSTYVDVSKPQLSYKNRKNLLKVIVRYEAEITSDSTSYQVYCRVVIKNSAGEVVYAGTEHSYLPDTALAYTTISGSFETLLTSADKYTVLFQLKVDSGATGYIRNKKIDVIFIEG